MFDDFERLVQRPSDATENYKYGDDNYKLKGSILHLQQADNFHAVYISKNGSKFTKFDDARKTSGRSYITEEKFIKYFESNCISLYSK